MVDSGTDSYLLITKLAIISLFLSSGPGDFICFLWLPAGLIMFAFYARLLVAVDGLPLLTLLAYFISLLPPGRLKNPPVGDPILS